MGENVAYEKRIFDILIAFLNNWLKNIQNFILIISEAFKISKKRGACI